MKIKEIYTKAGPVSDYFGYIILLFGWYLVSNVYISAQPELFGAVIDPILYWGLRLLVGPTLFAVVIAGIHERQEMQDIFSTSNFFSHIKLHLWRLICTNILSLIFYFVVTVIVILLTGYKLEYSDNDQYLLGATSAIFSTISLFWFNAVVVERKIFPGLARSIKTLLFNPLALAIGVLWAAFCFADTYFFTIKSDQIPLTINLARSGVFAVIRLLAVMYILVIYKNTWGSISNTLESVKTSGESSTTRPGEKLANVGFGFTFVSFVPFLHLVALTLGAMAIKRSHRFILKAAAACWIGGFFTIFYALLVAGLIAGHSSHSRMPDYKFLSEGNAELATYVKLLDQDEVQKVQSQLGKTSSGSSNRAWAFDCALALAKYNDHDIKGSLKDFYTALQKKPDRSEFYFYYGMALLDSNNKEMAMEQFQLALEHEPKLEIAGKYIDLIQNARQPSQVTSAVMSIVVLIILFALHEYGHAFAAWKLGDDTAKNLGRLTLNPIAHLDIFGSILLPGVLLLQQSGFVFGWAKPVPVNTANFKHPNRDHMLVSFAGPAVNLMVSMVCMIILALIVLLVRVFWPETITLNLVDPSSTVSMVGPQFSKLILAIIVFFKELFYTSLILGFFNLLPIPPLDGSWIVAGLLPPGLRDLFEKVRQFSFMFFILLTMTPVLDDYLSIPIGLAWLGLNSLISVLGFA